MQHHRYRIRGIQGVLRGGPLLEGVIIPIDEMRVGASDQPIGVAK